MIKLSILILALSVVAIQGRYGPAINVADEARRMVHMSNWASVGTISTAEPIKGFPMVNVVSVADSKIGAESTGNVYFYLTDTDISAMDVNKDNKVTFMFTEAQDAGCSKRKIDPWAYHCMRTMLTGAVQKLQKGTEEYKQGLEAFYSRHPSAVNWATHPISGHEFYLCKLDISTVQVYGWGGYTFTSLEEYFAGTDNVVATI